MEFLLAFSKRTTGFFRYFVGLFFLSTMSTCIDPVEPIFDLEEGLLYIEGYISNAEGASFVTVSESLRNALNEINFEFVSGADVVFVNASDGSQIPLIENETAYVPPENFTTGPGEEWELEVRFPDGRTYRSTTETMTSAVEILDTQVVFEASLEFREDKNEFVPGHQIFAEIQDPVNTENRYLWRYRSFENLDNCSSCGTGRVLREGRCVTNEQATRLRVPYFDYLCDTECWQIRYNEGISIFSDEFSDGLTTNLPVANVLLNTKEDIPY